MMFLVQRNTQNSRCFMLTCENEQFHLLGPLPKSVSEICRQDECSGSSLRITNHRSQKSPLSFTLHQSKTESNGLYVDRNHEFSEGFFKLLQFSRQCRSFLAHRAAPMTKTNLIFPAFSSRHVDFAVQFCFRCKFSLHEKQRSSQV